MNQEKSDIYKYTYTPGKDPKIDMDATRVLMTNSGDTKFLDKVPAIIDFINQFEKALSIEPSRAYVCKEPPRAYEKCGVILFVGDKRIMHSPPLLSAYTLLLRNGTKHINGNDFLNTVDGIINGKIAPAQENDKVYLTHGKTGIDLILARGITKVFGNDMRKNYPSNAKIPTHSLHHYSGIVAFSSGKSKRLFPDWVYPDKLSEPPPVCFS